MTEPFKTWAVTSPGNPSPADPRSNLSRDEVLVAWQASKTALETAKEAEMEWRKYVVKRAFPNPDEGTNTLDLGNGFKLKGNVKYNYKLDADNKIVNSMLVDLSATGNDGSFIADRLISWTPNFLLTEYRVIQEEAAEGNELAKQRLSIISKALTITDAAPTLNIVEPKGKK